MDQGASIAYSTLFSIWVSVVKEVSSSVECESRLDWHSELPEVCDLIPPFADDLACSGFWVPTWQIPLTCLNVHGL